MLRRYLLSHTALLYAVIPDTERERNLQAVSLWCAQVVHSMNAKVHYHPNEVQ